MTKILVAEDDQLLLTVYARMDIENTQQNEILVAHNGQEAIELIDAESPDIILLDLLMPEVDGFGVLEHLQESGKKESVKVYVFTNLSDDKNRKRAMDLGADEYFVKSDVSVDVLKKLIEQGKI